MKFENLTVERCTGNENARTFANWVNVVPDWLFAWAMIFGYAVRASVTLWLIRTAVWKVVRVAHRPWNTSVAYKSSRAPISCLYVYLEHRPHLNRGHRLSEWLGQTSHHQDEDDHLLVYRRTKDQRGQEHQYDQVASEVKSFVHIYRPSHMHGHLKTDFFSC